MIRHINIIPIFNQTPLISSTCVGIQRDAMSAQYGYATSPEEMAFELASLRKVCGYRDSYFAFGAYDGDRMVGFVNVIMLNGSATVRGLYVLPDYQRNGVGARLLAAAERAASVYAEKIELFAVDGAESFYESRKYNVTPGTGLHRKSIQGAAYDTVVPIFWCHPDIVPQFRRLGAEYDVHFRADDVNKYRAPMFAGFDNVGNISGYVVGAIPRTQNSEVSVRQLCTIAGAHGRDVARRLIEAMAKMNIR